MNIFAFVLGREQKIALAELEAVLRRFDFCICKNHPERGALINRGDESKGIPCYSILSLHQGVVIIKTEKSAVNSSQFAERMMSQLGGTVKIYEINQISNIKNQNEDIEALIARQLQANDSAGTLNFAISDYSGNYSVQELNKMGIAVKIKARKTRPVRFINNRERELSSATSYHKIWKTAGEEFGVFIVDQLTGELVNWEEPSNLSTNQPIGQQLIGKLIAVSNPDEWSRRDYGKPAGDKFSGMMPPKLARMMINIVLDPRNSKSKTLNSKQIQNSNFENSKIVSDLELRNSNLRSTIVDPFCGSGNILMEAALLGCEIVGSDISEKAVEDSKANLSWLMSNNQFPMINKLFNEPIPQLKIENSIFVADATTSDFASKLSTFNSQLSTRDIVVVTEPYLGKPKKIKMKRLKIKDEIEELKNLYLCFFRNLKLLATDYSLLSITFVFPIIETLDAGSISLYDECVDELSEMGYNTLCTLRYGRDYQVVKRQIALLSYTVDNPVDTQ